MKEIYPAYADSAAFYAVGTDPSEGIEQLVEYADAQGYPWPIAYPGDGMLSDLRVVVQSTKVAFDGQGRRSVGANGEVLVRHPGPVFLGTL